MTFRLLALVHRSIATIAFGRLGDLEQDLC